MQINAHVARVTHDKTLLHSCVLPKRTGRADGWRLSRAVVEWRVQCEQSGEA